MNFSSLIPPGVLDLFKMDFVLTDVEQLMSIGLSWLVREDSDDCVQRSERDGGLEMLIRGTLHRTRLLLPTLRPPPLHNQLLK